jgi:hypothetical protein
MHLLFIFLLTFLTELWIARRRRYLTFGRYILDESLFRREQRGKAGTLVELHRSGVEALIHWFAC